MRDDVTMWRRVLLDEPMPRMDRDEITAFNSHYDFQTTEKQTYNPQTPFYTRNTSSDLTDLGLMIYNMMLG